MNNGWEGVDETADILFNMNGVEYRCFKKPAEGKAPGLWIRRWEEENYNCAIWDAETCELRDTIFFSDVELYEMIPFLLNKHPELFEQK